ncbi:MAG: hypothetical protein ACOC80_09415 [Petrotogales bacterium]
MKNNKKKKQKRIDKRNKKIKAGLRKPMSSTFSKKKKKPKNQKTYIREVPLVKPGSLTKEISKEKQEN